MEIPKTYEPGKAEERWYQHWLNKNYFHSTPDEREPYTIVIPPPNVTGVLHMGHMLNNTIQDVLIRRARMLGKNACWVPGTDHASIATEAKVVQKLRQEGIKKSDLTRDEFLKHAFEWKDKHGGIILEQLKKLGASCDWERTHFTMDKEYSEVRKDYKFGFITKDEYFELKKEIIDKYAVYINAAERLNIIINQGISFGVKKDGNNPPTEQASSGSILRSSNPEKRPSPSVSATIYPAGYTIEGNDGNTWEISL
jgi:hypothetical protein